MAAVAALLAGPTVIAFFAGGFFDVPRAWAGIIAWALVLVAALVVPHPLPRDRAALVSLVGLAPVCGMDARLDDLGADQGRRVSGRRARVRLPRCARRRMCAVARTGAPGGSSSRRSRRASSS